MGKIKRIEIITVTNKPMNNSEILHREIVIVYISNQILPARSLLKQSSNLIYNSDDVVDFLTYFNIGLPR